MNQLINKLESRDALISIIGLGYVGLPLALSFLRKGYSVLGLDIDLTKLKKIREGKSYIEHIDLKQIPNLIEEEKFYCSSDFSAVSEADAVIFCLPTPLDKNREPDLSFVMDSLNKIAPHLKGNQVLSLESTTYPGTTEELLRPLLESQGWTVGKNIFLVYSPEREDPGNEEFENDTIPKLCSGVTEECLEVGISLYSQIIDKVIPVSSTKVAEMAKILENTYRAVNIALINELKVVADKMDIDIYEVVNAAASKPFGFKPFYPGPGVGGHCIPIDPFYLTWKAKEFGINTKFIELAGEVNNSMVGFTVSKVKLALNSLDKDFHNSKILVLGLSYKKNIDDLRESPALEILSSLKNLGSKVDYSDPHIPVLPELRQYNFNLKSIEVSEETLKAYDCVLITTDHDKFAWEDIKNNSKTIVDTRGVYNPVEGKIFRA